MLVVAIASEFDGYDAELYRELLVMLLGADIQRWRTEMRFNGCRSVAKLAPTYLRTAAERGVRHAILAVDNDGGGKRRPEHGPECVALVAEDDDDACRECWLTSVIPPSWAEDGRRSAIVVPVQTIETWLLHVRGDFAQKRPEAQYNRPALKKALFGSPIPSVAKCLEQARDLVRSEGALVKLRERPSFRRFEERVAAWRSSDRGAPDRPLEVA